MGLPTFLSGMQKEQQCQRIFCLPDSGCRSQELLLER